MYVVELYSIVVSGSKKAKKLDEGDSLGSSASPKQLWGERGRGAPSATRVAAASHGTNSAAAVVHGALNDCVL